MLTFRERIRHFTWANFAFTIAGGGTSSMLRLIPYRFRGLTAIGDIVFIFNFVMFWLFTGCMVARFIMYPDTIKKSITHPVESKFIPTYLLTWATILMDIELYGRGYTGAWRVTMIRVLYWMYVGVSIIQGTAQYAYYYLSRTLDFHQMSPGILLIIFPTMLSGCIAATLVDQQPHEHAMELIIGGATLQLLGFNVSFLLYGILVFKFLTGGLPSPDTRPAVFIMLGPMAFTGLCMVELGHAADGVFPSGYISNRVDTGGVFAMIGIYQGLICWATSIWFFLVAAVIVLTGAFRKGMSFKLAWCATVFPSAGMTSLTIKLGERLHSAGLKWAGTVMGACISAAYVLLVLLYAKAVLREEIMLPGRDEDTELMNVDLAPAKDEYPKTLA